MDLHAFLVSLRNTQPRPPALLIIHLGTNDLVTRDEYGLGQKIAVLLRDYVAWFPTTWIVWSDILPQFFLFRGLVAVGC